MSSMLYIPRERANTCAKTPSAASPRKRVSTLKERISCLYDNHVMADVVFTCRSESTLMAHKVILSSASKVFHELFNSGVNRCALKVSTEDNMHYIELKDCDLEHIQPVIKYMYTDDIGDITDKNVANVIYWSKKLKVRALIDTCVRYLELNINSDNCLKWWQTLSTRLPDETQLIDKCLHVVAVNARNILKGKDIINVSAVELTALLERNDLDVKEMDVFTACVRWAQQQCIRRGLVYDDHSLRQTLGPAFDKIRFPVMSSVDFGYIVNKYHNLLTKAEICALLAYINSGIFPEMPIPFNAKPRIRDTNGYVLSVTANPFVPVCYQSSVQPLGSPHSAGCCSSTGCCTPTGPPTPPGYSHLSPRPALLPVPLSPPAATSSYARSAPKQCQSLLTITDPNTGQNVSIEELAADLSKRNGYHWPSNSGQCHQPFKSKFCNLNANNEINLNGYPAIPTDEDTSDGAVALGYISDDSLQ